MTASARLSAIGLVALVALGGCNFLAEEEAPSAPPVRPVRTLVVEALPKAGQQAPFAGRIEATERVDLAFRIGGRVLERAVDVGAAVEAGSLVARLEPQNELNAVRSAEAALVAAEAAFVRADNYHGRQRELYNRGVTAQAYLQTVEQARTAADAQVAAAEAQLAIAREHLAFTELDADAPGIVTAVGVEAGEIVAPGQLVARIARRGGRDAVFDVPAQTLAGLEPGTPMQVSLADDRTVTATARVREIAPQADPVTRTFRVRAGLDDPPEALRLGVGVSGTILAGTDDGYVVPLSALKEDGGAAAVFVVDPETLRLSLRPVTLGRRDAAQALVTEGLATGDIVVTAGVGSLADGQAVRILGAES